MILEMGTDYKMAKCEKFAFLLKTYPKDFKNAVRLVKSFAKFNRDKLKLYIVCPSESKKELMEQISDASNIVFIEEEKFTNRIDYTIWGLPPGYINQEIIKLSFWELGLCKNYFCLDSDSMFIRDFTISDFMHDNDYPYTVMYDDKELLADPAYYRSYWKPREKAVNEIKNILGIDLSERLWTCHGFQTFHAAVLKKMKEYMSERGYSYADLMAIAPYEFTWYNFYLQKEKVIPIYVSAPIFKTFHTKEQLILSCVSGITVQDLSRAYAGIVINSNYSEGKDDPFTSIMDYQLNFPGKYSLFFIREGIRNFIRQIKHLISVHTSGKQGY